MRVSGKIVWSNGSDVDDHDSMIAVQPYVSALRQLNEANGERGTKPESQLDRVIVDLAG
jgi:hypothetical protein